MKFTNVSPLGALDVPDIGAIVGAGEEFDVADDLGRVFAAQPGNYAPADEAAREVVATLEAERAAAVEADLADEVEPVDEPEPKTARRSRAGATTKEAQA